MNTSVCASMGMKHETQRREAGTCQLKKEATSGQIYDRAKGYSTQLQVLVPRAIMPSRSLQFT